MRIEYRYQNRTHSRYVVVAWTMDSLYKQLVEYCCGSLSSSLVNYITCVLYQISALEIYCLYYYWTLVQQLPQQSVAQVQVDHQTKKLYIVANILKYRSNNIILCYYIYSRLLGTIRVVVWNSMSYASPSIQKLHFCGDITFPTI